MLFTSAAFAFLFLPIALVGYFWLARGTHRGAAAWLFLASLLFYAYWVPEFVALLLASICLNYLIGERISLTKPESGGDQSLRTARLWLITGVVSNLLALAYFKYANFFIGTIEGVFGISIGAGQVLLPIGISFFTFTQIAFLVDVYKKDVKETRFVHYGLFVTYFPHLVAGPVLHHAQMIPQFDRPETYRFSSSNFSAGLTLFALGLFKKIVIADSVSPYADAVFTASDEGLLPSSSEAWIGAIAYTLQLYFDFSGYSDMAIGLSWLFNVQLPINFNSPYKARNISEFWRRWHMTLSAFLRDYLYIALGGNRKGPIRRYTNLLATMLLGGLWHGASWTFVFWGGLHGAYLCINHAFQKLHTRVPVPGYLSTVSSPFCWLITMGAVIVSWVFFRAATFDGAWRIILSMAQPGPSSGDGVASAILWNAGLHQGVGWMLCVAFGALACLAPNSNWWFEYIKKTVSKSLLVASFLAGVSVCGICLLVFINEVRDSVSAFIYFNF